MNKIVDVSSYERLEELEKAHFEYNSYMNIIAYMISSNQYNNPGFKFYQSECAKALSCYEKEKELFTEIVFEPLLEITELSGLNWDLSFRTKEVEIYD